MRPVWANKNGVLWGMELCRGGEATTSVYRFAHHDNDYVIAIVAATQRPKRKDEGRSLNSERLKGRDIDKQAQRPDTLHCCPRGEGYQ